MKRDDETDMQRDVTPTVETDAAREARLRAEADEIDRLLEGKRSPLPRAFEQGPAGYIAPREPPKATEHATVPDAPVIVERTPAPPAEPRFEKTPPMPSATMTTPSPVGPVAPLASGIATPPKVILSPSLSPNVPNATMPMQGAPSLPVALAHSKRRISRRDEVTMVVEEMPQARTSTKLIAFIAAGVAVATIALFAIVKMTGPKSSTTTAPTASTTSAASTMTTVSAAPAPTESATIAPKATVAAPSTAQAPVTTAATAPTTTAQAVTTSAPVQSAAPPSSGARNGKPPGNKPNKPGGLSIDEEKQ